MGIFTRMRDIISSNINAMLDKAEDPEKLVRLMIQEMEDTLVEIKASCAGAMAAKKKVQRALDHANNRAKEWKEKAALAVDKGRDDLAREALVESKRAAFNSMPPTLVDDRRLDCHVLKVKLGRKRIVRHDTAHSGSTKEHEVWFLASKK